MNEDKVYNSKHICTLFPQCSNRTAKKSFFSFIIDETTDVFYYERVSCLWFANYTEKKAVVTHFYIMIPVASGTSESVYEVTMNLFEKD